MEGKREAEEENYSPFLLGVGWEEGRKRLVATLTLVSVWQN